MTGLDAVDAVSLWNTVGNIAFALKLRLSTAIMIDEQAGDVIHP